MDTGSVRGFPGLPAASAEELQGNGTGNAGSWLSACLRYELFENCVSCCLLIFKTKF